MAWTWPWAARPGRTDAPERKDASPGFVALHLQGEASWTRRDYATLAREGFMRSPAAHRSIRLIAESAGGLNLLLRRGRAEVTEHPLLDLLAAPNARQAGGSFMEALYGHLLISGNAYLELVEAGPEARELHLLRPDRVSVVGDAAGWPVALDYGTGRTKRRVPLRGEDSGGALHLRMFHPLDDHYGFPPLEAALTALDLHHAAARWNKALLDNSARPSGALVYAPKDGSNLTDEQFTRLKEELEHGYTGASRAGRPLLLDCLTLWLSNTMLAEQDVEARSAELVSALAKPHGPWFVVSNEVGLGIVPDTPLGRRFRDAQGRLNQQVAAVADTVLLMVAGLPVRVK